MTHTRVHTSVTFADPLLACAECGEHAGGFHDPEKCGCEGLWRLTPCGHLAEPLSTCPSWGPVDGCRCPAPVPHPAATDPSDGGGGRG
jgi:hypothetical protein